MAAHAAPRRLRLSAGYAVGFTGYVLGLLASANYDLPTGAAIVCFLAAVVRTILALRAKIFPRGRFNFFAIALGFLFQSAFLTVRGHELGRCPLTNLFEVFVFLAILFVGLVYVWVKGDLEWLKRVPSAQRSEDIMRKAA